VKNTQRNKKREVFWFKGRELGVALPKAPLRKRTARRAAQGVADFSGRQVDLYSMGEPTHVGTFKPRK
jgi:hypothetical protein